MLNVIPNPLAKFVIHGFLVCDDDFQEWQDDGGVMILGYDMFRNLASGSNVRQKKLRETFEKCLVNPGTSASRRPNTFLI